MRLHKWKAVVLNITWTHLYSVFRSWNCTFAAACYLWRLTRAWGGVVPEMLTSFSCRENHECNQSCGEILLSEWRGQSGRILRNSSSCSDMLGWRGELGVHIRSAKKKKTSQSLNLQMPPNTTQVMKLTIVWNRMPLASVQHGHAVYNKTTDNQDN